jgi:predicted Zn-dependent protease
MERDAARPERSERENADSAVFDLIQRGTPEEQGAAIEELISRAEQSGDKRDWNIAALGLQRARRFDEAISILDQLVRADPADDVYRLSLATNYSQVSQVALCRFHLQYLSDHGATDEMRKLGREQLDGYERFIGLTEEDSRLRELQQQALLEATGREDCTPEDFVSLSRVLNRMAQAEPGKDWMKQSRTALEAGANRFPTDVKLLELLVAAYLTQDPEHRLDPTLRRLERLAPDSQVFDVLSHTYRQDTSYWERDMSQRTDRLFKEVTTGEPEISKSALGDLAHIVEQYPDNPWYRLTYAFALLSPGRHEEALRQARMLAAVDNPSHNFHFNLGQVFWISGDAVQGRRHLQLAAEYAKDDTERHDAWERISELEKV